MNHVVGPWDSAEPDPLPSSVETVPCLGGPGISPLSSHKFDEAESVTARDRGGGRRARGPTPPPLIMMPGSVDGAALSSLSSRCLLLL